MDLLINGAPRPLPEAWRDETLLDVLREAFGLVGTKFGCGVGQCGACSCGRGRAVSTLDRRALLRGGGALLAVGFTAGCTLAPGACRSEFRA